MKWVDVEEIAEELENRHQDVDIISIRFTELQKLVLELPLFEDEIEKCNERVLEAIQANWIEIRNENS